MITSRLTAGALTCVLALSAAAQTPMMGYNAMCTNGAGQNVPCGATELPISASLLGVNAQAVVSSTDATMSSWDRALASCTTQRVRVANLGDSTTVVFQTDGSGSGPVNPNNRWSEQERIYLQSRCGNGGTGITPAIKFLYSGSPNPNNQFYVGISGSWSQDATLGPVQTDTNGTHGVLVKLAPGASIFWTSSSIQMAVDHVNTYCGQGPSFGTLGIVIKDITDQTQLTTSSCGGSASLPAAQLATSSAFPAQIVNVHNNCPGGGGYCYFYANEGTVGSTGAIVDNLGSASGVAEMYTNSGAFAFTDLAPGGYNLVQTNFMLNEPALSFSTSSFQNALHTIAAHEKATATAPSILYFGSPVVSDSSAGQLPAYAAALRQQAQTDRVKSLNVQDEWGTAFIAAMFDSDAIHSSDAGALAEWDLIKRAIVKNEPTPPNGTTSPTGSNTISNSAGYATQTVQTTATAFSYAAYDLSATGADTFSYALFTTGAGGPADDVGAIALIDNTTQKAIWSFSPTLGNLCFLPASTSHLGTCSDAVFSLNGDGSTKGLSAGASATTYGVPTVTSSNASVSLSGVNQSVDNTWENNDHVFTMVVIPSSTIAAGTAFAAVAFGKTWYNAAGTYTENPSCLISGVGAALGVPAGALTVSPTSVRLATSQSLTSGTTYIFTAHCDGNKEQ